MARVFVAASTQYLANASYPVLDGVSQFSVAVWMHKTAEANDVTVNGAVDANNLWGVQHYLDTNIYISVRNGSLAYGSIAKTGAGLHHYGLAFDGTQGVAADRVRAYYDGGVLTLSLAGNWPATAPTVGKIEVGRETTGSIYADARVAELGVWDAPLSADDFARLALGYSPLFVRPQNLLSYWPLIGRTSPEVDVVGGYGLTVINAPAAAEHVRVFHPVGPSWSGKAAAVAADALPQAWAQYRARRAA